MTARLRTDMTTTDQRASVSPRRRRVFLTITLLLVLLVVEAGARLIVRAMPALDLRPVSAIMEDQSQQIEHLLDRSQPQWVEIHPVLGWRYAPGFRNDDHQMNAQALRSARAYDTTPPPAVIRVAAFGDSFVYGNEVRNPESWPALIEREDPQIEVLNYGVGGYGLDQAYLRYTLEGSALTPQIVIIGFTPDDLGRVTNVYRRFVGATEMPLFKPRYVLDDHGELKLLASPVREESDYQRLLRNPREVLEHGRDDLWYKPAVYENPLYDASATVRVGSWLATRVYRRHIDPDRFHHGALFNPTSSAFRINVALFRAFSKAVDDAGARPLILILPDRASVERARDDQPVSYEPLLRQLRDHRLAVADALDAFKSLPHEDVSGWFARRGHYSPEGNSVVAAWLRPQLRHLLGTRD
jgi:hypothetical protein